MLGSSKRGRSSDNFRSEALSLVNHQFISSVLASRSLGRSLLEGRDDMKSNCNLSATVEESSDCLQH